MPELKIRTSAPIALIVLASAAFALAFAPSPVSLPSVSPSPLIPDAVDILARAEEVARNNADPPYIVYDMHELFVHHGKQYTYDYHVWYRSDGKGLMQNDVTDRQGNHEQRFGYPFPSSPDANFLLYATPPPSPPPQYIVVPTPGPGGRTAPPVVAVEPVEANRYYDVTFVGVEDYQGHPVYHLGLTPGPNVDEKAHPWKDVWVDTQTFEIWKAHAQASGSKGPAYGSIEATVEFEPVGQYWMISEASGDGQVHFGFISDSGHYEYYFSGFDFPNTLPDWYFDPVAFRHRGS
jgi:hypothetical protein